MQSWCPNLQCWRFTENESGQYDPIHCSDATHNTANEPGEDTHAIKFNSCSSFYENTWREYNSMWNLVLKIIIKPEWFQECLCIEDQQSNWSAWKTQKYLFWSLKITLTFHGYNNSMPNCLILNSSLNPTTINCWNCEPVNILIRVAS